MQDVFRHHDVYRRYDPQSNRHAPTAQMVDPNLEAQPLSAIGEVPSDDSKKSNGGPPASRSENATRGLPPVEVDQDSIEDAYVQFIFYCNPNIPLSTDTMELRRGFRSPPKTDGKVFDTFTLFGLIRRLEIKDIDTWSQLVIEMGVEPPDATKNQSTQKVQQFAVRLKRWLHAFHIDAFFQYLLGKPNTYSTEIPGPNQSLLEAVRDGVPSEEDLALRALLPEWRPKRGRRKVDHPDGLDDISVKRIQRASSATAEPSRPVQQVFSDYPQSAFPWTQGSNHDDAWTAANRAVASNTSRQSQPFETQQPSTLYAGQQNFWVDVPESTATLSYPQSAITPSVSHNTYGSVDTPQSAHPQTASPAYRGRKRHGPAVSAAWSVTNGASAGKLRGRPPSDLSVQDGPFSTFPANPTLKQASPRNNIVALGSASEGGIQTPNSTKNTQSAASPVPAMTSGIPLVRKPSKLQLQVPQSEGGPVRLATPPPKVLVNGEDNIRGPSSSMNHERRTSADFFSSLDHDVDEFDEDGNSESHGVDWKRRALLLKRKLDEKTEELKALRRRVMDAVM